MEEPKRLLCIVGGMNAGGAETFLMKLYRSLDKTKYQMDFYVSSQMEGFYDKEILSLGGKIFHSVPKSINFLLSFIAIKNKVKEENYNYVLRASQHSLSALDLFAAKLGGAKVLIYRSSNSNTGGGRLNVFLHKMFIWLPILIPTIKIAPSLIAADFMFGRNSTKKRNTYILHNALEIDDFIFNPRKREIKRKEFNIHNKFVVGHVGRFSKQKNHLFLIDIFSEISKQKSNAILLLVGEGELEKKIKEKIENMGLSDKVIFAGIRTDIANILMAMDVFVFPSYFEGMPNTVIEAQATGLPCVISNTITPEANITELVNYISLNYSADMWAQKALECAAIVRKNMKEILKEKKYDINNVTRQFENYILNY